MKFTKFTDITKYMEENYPPVDIMGVINRRKNIEETIRKQIFDFALKSRSNSDKSKKLEIPLGFSVDGDYYDEERRIEYIIIGNYLKYLDEQDAIKRFALKDQESDDGLDRLLVADILLVPDRVMEYFKPQKKQTVEFEKDYSADCGYLKFSSNPKDRILIVEGTDTYQFRLLDLLFDPGTERPVDDVLAELGRNKRNKPKVSAINNAIKEFQEKIPKRLRNRISFCFGGDERRKTVFLRFP